MRANEPDELGLLLRQWPDMEPPPAFEQDVLRRIRLEVGRPRSQGLAAWLPAWLGSPSRLAWAAGTPLALALVAGVVGARALPERRPMSLAPFGSLTVADRGTLTRAYLALAGSTQR